MNPRELLSQKIVRESENFEVGLEGAVIFERRLERLLSKYAIGRWVSVDERLPVVDSSGMWAGYTKDLEGTMSFGYYDYHNLCVFYSSWLELDMPSGKGGIVKDIDTSIKRLERLADDYQSIADQIGHKLGDSDALLLLKGVVIGMRRCINELRPVHIVEQPNEKGE